MNGFVTSDYTLLYKLRIKLKNLVGKEYSKYPSLSKLANCLVKAKPQGVHILKSDNHSKFVGVLHCHRHSVCPVCAAFKHSKLKYYLNAAFQMQKQQNLVAFMTTFTIVSAKNIVKDSSSNSIIEISAKEMLELLLLTQKKFNQNKFFAKLKKDLSISDSFFVTETTYSLDNGWHPHNHALYWLPAENLNTLNSLEKKFQEKWKLCQKLAIEQFYKCDEDSNSDEDFIKRMKRNLLLRVLEHSKASGLVFSKEEEKIRIADSSNYFWSDVDEVTGIKFKKARGKNSRTIFELLQDALLNEDNLAWSKYIEFAQATYKKQVFRFSQNFLKKIKQFLLFNPEIFSQKKSSKEEQNQEICWFSQESWQYNNFFCPKFMLFVSSFCQVENTFDLIIELCENLNLKMPLKKGPFILKAA